MRRPRESGEPRVRRVPAARPIVEAPIRAAGGSGAEAPDGVSEDAIRVRAYAIFLGRGGAPGRELEDWLAAERALRTAAPGELS